MLRYMCAFARLQGFATDAYTLSPSNQDNIGHIPYTQSTGMAVNVAVMWLQTLAHSHHCDWSTAWLSLMT